MYEDPYLFTDAFDNWHLLYHVYETGEPGITCRNSTVSAHSFSVDGHTWHTTTPQPYGTVVELAGGGRCSAVDPPPLPPTLPNMWRKFIFTCSPGTGCT